ncbi:MAG: response regulator transcription factor [Thermoactinomyces sp.]
MRILVAEDDLSVCEMLDLFLRREGFVPTFVHDGQTALAEFEQGDYGMLILDWMLPQIDGVKVCRKIREKSEIPIIMLTARTAESEQVLGFEVGVDDYVTKPFSPLALAARMKALLRRTGRQQTNQKENCCSRVKVDDAAHEVWIDGEKLAGLTPKEFELLQLFARHPRRVFSREELLEIVWGFDYYGDIRTVDAHIKRLRKKMGQARHLLQTVWGIGYKLAWDETDEDL